MEKAPGSGIGTTIIFGIILVILFGCGVVGAVTANISGDGSDVLLAQIDAEKAESFEKRAVDDIKDLGMAAVASNVAIANAGFESNTRIAYTTPLTLFAIAGIIIGIGIIIGNLNKRKELQQGGRRQENYYE